MVSYLTHILIVWVSIVSIWFLPSIRPDNNLGCSFVANVCEPFESCLHDGIFGRCESSDGSFKGPKDDWLFDTRMTHLLGKEMFRLFEEGFRWKDSYTQCVIRQIMFTHSANYDPGLCSRILQVTLPNVQSKKVDPDQRDRDILDIIDRINTLKLEPIDVTSTPSPPSMSPMESMIIRNRNPDYNRLLGSGVEGPLPSSSSPSAPSSPSSSSPVQVQGHSIGGIELDNSGSKKVLEPELPIEQDRVSDNPPEFRSVKHMREQVDLPSSLLHQDVPATFADAVPVILSEADDQDESDREMQPVMSDQLKDALFKRNSRPQSIASSRSVSLNGPNQGHRSFNRGHRVSNLLMNRDPLFDEKIPMFDEGMSNVDYGYHRDRTIDSDDLVEDRILPMLRLLEAVDLKDDLKYDLKGNLKPNLRIEDEGEGEDDVLFNQEINRRPWIFPGKRVDIKKPGPEFWKSSPQVMMGSEESDQLKGLTMTGPEPIISDKRLHQSMEPDGLKEINPDLPTGGVSSQLKSVDLSHTFFFCDTEVTYDEANNLIHHLSRLLNLPSGTLSNIRVAGRKIFVKVNPNSKGYNSTLIASKAELLEPLLLNATGIHVSATGIGDRDNETLEVARSPSYSSWGVDQWILLGSAVGLVMATMLGLVKVCMIASTRREELSRKIRHLFGSEPHEGEDSAEVYQDLLRQRMQQNDKKETMNPTGASGAVSSPRKPHKSNSQSSDSSRGSNHSCRSSTSSWTEEPAANNMGISTGHMILSYMEDHLRNRDRLDQEWEGLCGYEADPSATDVALLSQNKTKNRCPEILPFDHSRVILNDLTNCTKSDYINANTITDHDPRNPAYIATQGPLPNTTGDFWQMIWEQGSHTIVMLTRLMESGHIMCHRYWPEEGAQTHGHFEVQLVSEHIWCEDYLVRSLMVKNKVTNETRTITQFHFLSWPEKAIPSSVKPILDFRRKVNKSFKGKSGPIVVHCSDGVGRTGTYCLIDMVLNRMSKGIKEIDIAATLEHMRDQRISMVRTKSQFEFVLKSVAEEVHAILRCLSGSGTN